FRGKNTYLIDMEGNVIHYWPYPEGWSSPGRETVEKHARLMRDGTLFRGVINRSESPVRGTRYHQYSWDGELLWEHIEERPGYNAHHDFAVIWNPKLEQRTLLYLATRELTHEEVLALGADPSLSDDYASNPDGIVEVDMDGNVIWEWNISDHVVQDVDPALPGYGVVSENPGKMDINFRDGGVSGDWIHANSFDYNEKLDHIVINNSTFSESYVIDHGATFVAGDPDASVALAASDAGDFLYRWGNPCAYDSGRCPSVSRDGRTGNNGHQQVFFSHDIQWIAEQETGAGDPLPGEGNMLIFDNGSRRLGTVYSSVIEFNPYDGPMESGVYTPETEAGYGPGSAAATTARGMAAGMGMGMGMGGAGGGELVSRQVVWRFHSTLPNSFYSLINSGANGHFFEVAPDGEVVWEYINPVGDRTGDDHAVRKIMKDSDGRMYNSVFKIVRYPLDYPGLAGKDLTPMGPITELWPDEAEAP
ncbi:MAG: aryl-sulfate sulfotransferase, partial [Planctomycetota bacterium]